MENCDASLEAEKRLRAFYVHVSTAVDFPQNSSHNRYTDVRNIPRVLHTFPVFLKISAGIVSPKR